MYRLERAHGSIEVLVYLYIYGRTAKTELAMKLRPSFETLQKSLATLEELGLVDRRKQTEFPFRQAYDLSSRGRRLVESPVFRWPSILWERSGEGLLRTAEPGGRSDITAK